MTSREKPDLSPIGRGAGINTPNRFERIHVEPEFDHLDDEDQQAFQSRKVPTEYFMDDSQSVVSENNSPDISFRFSINPYRGCAHGCSYCYARPYHEYLGMSAGLDFESKIFVKLEAPQLFRKWLGRKLWVCEPVNLSGITDPYQPAERKFEITRGCLKVASDCNQPIYLITKNAMVTRDLDILKSMAERNLIRIVISVTSLDQELIRVMEPRTSSPVARLRAVEQLAKHNIPVMTNVAPIILGLTDHEVPVILKSAADAGAEGAKYTVLRLPGPVEEIFLGWVDTHFRDRRQKIENGIRSMREGKLGSSQFFDRMKGTGAIAEQIRAMFRTFSRQYDLDKPLAPLDCESFVRPSGSSGQKTLF